MEHVSRSHPLISLACRLPRLVSAACAIAVFSLCASAGLAGPFAGRRNPIERENARHGAPNWLAPAATPPAIAGYASETEARAGGVLHLHVSTDPAATYTIRVYRLGWYAGAGARLIRCLPSCSTSLSGKTLSTPAPDAVTGKVDAAWPVAARVKIGRNWASGYYEAELVLRSGPGSGTATLVPFLVSPPRSSRSAILVVAATNTWQAYNNWGGKSLYAYNSVGGSPAVEVSFDRPLAPTGQNPLSWEYPFVRFLEQNGFDATYTTDDGVDANPAQLLRHRLVIDLGHDEYWSPRMRAAFLRARAKGVNLAFIGGDQGTWQVRYADDRRALVEYRTASADPDPVLAQKTTRFRSIGEPECALRGVQYEGGLAKATDPPRSYVPAPGLSTTSWALGTGVQTSAPLLGTVGYEWDTVVPGCVSNLRVLFHYSGQPSNADAVTYSSPSGAQVFSTGSLQFVWALDDWDHTSTPISPGLRAFMRRALAGLSAR